MKIGFVTSIKGKKQFEAVFTQMVNYLTKKNHDVYHMLHITDEELHAMTFKEKEELFQDFMHDLKQTDLIFAECSLPSLEVGFDVSSLIDSGKPVVVLRQKGSTEIDYGLSELVCSRDSVGCFEYYPDEPHRVLEEALSLMQSKVDKRFTIIFPARTLQLLEEISHKKKLPKAVYIRQLIEKALRGEGLSIA